MINSRTKHESNSFDSSTRLRSELLIGSMLVISVIPKSRRLARADLLNASHHCDLIELCLDHLVKEADVGKLAHSTEKPLIISCRTVEEGGAFKGSNEERAQILRQAIIAEPNFVELETSIASDIPRFGKTKRIISVRGRAWSSTEWEAAYEQAADQNADYVKLVCQAQTLDEVWPLMTLITKKHATPIIPVVEGAAGLLFSILAKKYNSPWTYAALEPGRESYPGQPNVWDLKEVYHWDQINSKTAFVSLVGFGAMQKNIALTLNQCYEKKGLRQRCLPCPLGHHWDHLSKQLKALQIHSILVGSEMANGLCDFADENDEPAKLAQYADILVRQNEKWYGYNFMWRSVLRALEDQLQLDEGDERPLNRRNVIVIGATGLSQAVAFGVKRRNGILSICTKDEKEGQRLSALFDCRYVPFHSLYETLADVVVLADPNMGAGAGRHEMNASYFRPNMVVLDLSTLPHLSALGEGAKEHQSKIVPPENVYLDLVRSYFKGTTGERLEPEEVRELWSFNRN